MLKEVKKKELTGTMKELVIGDDLYLKELRHQKVPSEIRRYKNLIYTRKDNFSSQITLTAYEDTEMDSVLIVIHTVEEGKKPYMRFIPEKDSISYRANGELKEKELGCDTASFSINGMNFSIGADGCYGVVFEHPNQNETIIQLFATTDFVLQDRFIDDVFFAIEDAVK